jgi:hypothetical protein
MPDPASITSMAEDLHLARLAVQSIALDLHRIADAVVSPPVTGIVARPGTPTERGNKMAKVTLTKGKKKLAAGKKATAGAPVVDFQINDNENSTCTVWATNAAGDQIDISAVATLAVTSSDTTVIAVDPPAGMTFQMHALKLSTPGTPVNLTIVATVTDGSSGPFTVTLPCDVGPGGATGLVVIPGTPTVRP